MSKINIKKIMIYFLPQFYSMLIDNLAKFDVINNLIPNKCLKLINFSTFCL